jgi:hypothetical protein
MSPHELRVTTYKGTFLWFTRQLEIAQYSTCIVRFTFRSRNAGGGTGYGPGVTINLRGCRLSNLQIHVSKLNRQQLTASDNDDQCSLLGYMYCMPQESSHRISDALNVLPRLHVRSKALSWGHWCNWASWRPRQRRHLVVSDLVGRVHQRHNSHCGLRAWETLQARGRLPPLDDADDDGEESERSLGWDF